MGRVRFNFTAGALIRGQLRRQLTEQAWNMGLDIQFQEDKSIFDSAYRVTVTGPDEDVSIYYKAVERWMGQIQE